MRYEMNNKKTDSYAYTVIVYLTRSLCLGTKIKKFKKLS
jgi:hypothetical protein